MTKIKVDLGSRSYDILIGAGLLENFGKIIKEKFPNRQIIIISDPLVLELHGHPIKKALKEEGLRFNVVLVPRGERYKNQRSATQLYDALVKNQVHRDDLIVALGGGVIGDLAGFVAATYMRGLHLIQVPTTLLSQVDSSVGGKTGVNHPKGKNLIGVFYQPNLVIIDVNTLVTLPERELQTGLAEIVKYGIISDEVFFKFLEANVHHLNAAAFKQDEKRRAALRVWERIIEESCKIKAQIVASDEHEASLRMVLNLGHTFGHAIETVTQYTSYTHGEAVAIGLVAAAKLSHSLGIMDNSQVERIVTLLTKLQLPVAVEKLSCRKIFNHIRLDKKVRGNKIHLILPEKIGKVLIKTDVPEAKIKRSLKQLGCK